MWWLLLLWGTGCRQAGSVVVAHGFSCVMAYPTPGIEPMSSALAGGFLTMPTREVPLKVSKPCMDQKRASHRMTLI